MSDETATETEVTHATLPAVSQAVEHNGRQYQVTNIEWDPGEDEIIVTLRRKWNDGSSVFETSTARGFLGQSVDLAIVDEAHRWLRRPGDM